jgi:hypothetical protein
MKVTLEIEMEELAGINCLFEIDGELIEGTIAKVVGDKVKIATGAKEKWYVASDVRVLNILFR